MKRHSSVAADWGKRGRRVAPKSAGRRTSYEGNRRRFWQFIACGAIFVVLVAAKLLLPGKLEPISQTITGVLEQNMDVQAVFSAVGDIFTKETDARDALDEVYQAVFAPEKIEETGIPEELPDEYAALELLRSYRREASDKTQETGVSELAYILYSDENLPENVTLSQEILGFDYCTPVCGTVSSEFGYRDHPTEGAERFHYGVDLAANSGTAVVCFANGTVTAVGESSSYGKYCVVSHENGYSTLYAHCSRITASSGAEVLQGEKIAEVGETGMATGPHLHFELQRDSTYLNPIYYVTTA